MNRRQAKKKRKKEMEKLEKGLDALIKCTRGLGEFLSKWTAEGMPFQDKKEGHDNESIPM